MGIEETSTLASYLKASIALQIRQMSGGWQADDKPELVLAAAGLSSQDIADVLRKNVGAVSKAIQRAGKRATKKGR